MESVIALALSLGHCSADDELRLAAQTAAELVPDACHVSLALLSEDESVLHYFGLSPEGEGTHAHVGTFPRQNTGSGVAISLKKPILTSIHAPSGRRRLDWQQLEQTTDAAACICLPLTVADKALGTLNIASPQTDAFRGRAQELVAFAAVLAPIIGLQRFRKELKSVEALLRRILPAHIADRLHRLHHNPSAEPAASAAATPGPDQAEGAGPSQPSPARSMNTGVRHRRRQQDGPGGAGASSAGAGGETGPNLAGSSGAGPGVGRVPEKLAGWQQGVGAARGGWGEAPLKQGKRQLQQMRDWGHAEGAPSVPRLLLDMGSFLVTAMAVFHFALRMLWPTFAAVSTRASAVCAAALCLVGCCLALGDLDAYGRHRVKVMAGVRFFRTAIFAADMLWGQVGHACPGPATPLARLCVDSGAFLLAVHTFSCQVPLRLHILVHTGNAALLMGAVATACHLQCASAQCALLHVSVQLAVGILLPTLALMYAQRASARLSAQLME